eukprot:6190356-Pleurochrysis_carterae.AAC.1
MLRWEVVAFRVETARGVCVRDATREQRLREIHGRKVLVSQGLCGASAVRLDGTMDGGTALFYFNPSFGLVCYSDAGACGGERGSDSGGDHERDRG